MSVVTQYTLDVLRHKTMFIYTSCASFEYNNTIRF